MYFSFDILFGSEDLFAYLMASSLAGKNELTMMQALYLWSPCFSFQHYSSICKLQVLAEKLVFYLGIGPLGNAPFSFHLGCQVRVVHHRPRDCGHRLQVLHGANAQSRQTGRESRRGLALTGPHTQQGDFPNHEPGSYQCTWAHHQVCS